MRAAAARARALWDEFFFPSTSVAPLACLRIALVGLHLALFAPRLGELQAFLDGSGFIRPQALIRFLSAAGLEDQMLTEGFVTAAWDAMIAFGLLSLVGLGTRVVMPVYAVLSLWVISFYYSFGEVHHPETIFTVMLLALSLSPCNRCFSVDAILGRRRDRSASGWGPQVVRADAYWPVRLVQVLMAMAYLEAFAAKMRVGGLRWANGHTLQTYLLEEALKADRDWLQTLAQYRWAAIAMSVGVLFFEATFWVVLLDRFAWVRTIRSAYLAVGLVMHLMMYFMQSAEFWPWMSLYLVWVPWARLTQRSRARVPQPPVPPVPGSVSAGT